MPVTLIKLRADHQRLRTWSVDGISGALPALGRCFELVGAALSGMGFRLVNTSPVVAIEQPEGEGRGVYRIATMSGSLYLVLVRAKAAEVDLWARESHVAKVPV